MNCLEQLGVIQSEQLGLLVLGLITIGGFFLQWKADQRREAERFEPKQNPSIDYKVDTKIAASEDRILARLKEVSAEQKASDAAIADQFIRLNRTIKQDNESQDTKRSQQVATLHNEIRDLGVNVARVETHTQHLSEELKTIKTHLNQRHVGIG